MEAPPIGFPRFRLGFCRERTAGNEVNWGVGYDTHDDEQWIEGG